jgi:ribosomal protein L37AE/L43A
MNKQETSEFAAILLQRYNRQIEKQKSRYLANKISHNEYTKAYLNKLWTCPKCNEEMKYNNKGYHIRQKCKYLEESDKIHIDTNMKANNIYICPDCNKEMKNSNKYWHNKNKSRLCIVQPSEEE